jgi:hypothetical protein
MDQTRRCKHNRKLLIYRTSAKGIFRLRFVDETKKCYATHKGKGVMKEGINSAEEVFLIGNITIA